jgi:NitT/TauT family transport system substrate-binding protein
VDLRRQYNLLPDLGPQADEEVLAYFTETVEAGALPLNGGGPDAAADDLGFVAAAGQIEGDPAALDVGDFWEFGPLERVIATVGTR